MELRVRLVNATVNPLDNVAATARTCYSSRGIILPEDIKNKKKRDQLVIDLLKAGHHTTLQHVFFQFAIEGVSRLFVWSFLHSHPFYNSEQVSQRYVRIREENVYIPGLKGQATQLYMEGVNILQGAYKNLIELLFPIVESHYFTRFKARKKKKEKWLKEVEKKTLEFARYVLPLSTQVYMHHTINALTLLRYYRAMSTMDAPEEERKVVSLMIAEVLRWEPEFHKLLRVLDEEEPVTREFPWKLTDAKRLKEQFDEILGDKLVKLVGYKENHRELVVESLHEILGLPYGTIKDEEAIELIMNPSKNPQLSSTLNMTYMDKLTRPLLHVSYTFIKKLSHTADSQNQRHRTTHGTRPFIVFHVDEEPDYITPPIILEDRKVENFYRETMERIWEILNKLRKTGYREEALYLLPNAFTLRIRETADLLSLMHKHRMRLCLNAQEEIWRISMEELKEINRVDPEFARFLMPPCRARYLAHKRPYCPEGSRYCGVPVWTKNPLALSRMI